MTAGSRHQDVLDWTHACWDRLPANPGLRGRAGEMAAKLAGLRVFEDAEGRMNLGLAEVGGAILAVSQFTLAGSVQRGRRPGFENAMAPEPARELFQRFVHHLRATGLPVETGFFREHMEVVLVNEGPVTFVVERPERL